MKISKYIGDLLFQYECVVIPDFGGFITKEIPSKINTGQHNFYPPSKEIVFNVHLKTNDGLLINHVAHSENISYNESKTRIENFARRCRVELSNGKQINFHDVGFLFLNENDEIIFKQDVKNNYLADSFGLTSFISPPVKRISRTEKIDRRFKNRKRISIKADFRKVSKWGAVAIPLVAVLIWGFLNVNSVKHFYDNYAQLIPFFSSSPSEYLVKNINKFPMKDISNDVMRSDSVNLPDNIVNEKSTKIPQGVEENKIPTNKEEEKKRQLDKGPSDLGVTKSIKDDKVPETPVENPVENPVDTSIEESVEKALEKTLQKDNSDFVQPLQLQEVVKIEDNTPKYFIIGGAFESLSNAQKLVENLKNQGFDSEIVGLNKYGLYRVSYSKFSDRTEASKQLKVIKKDKNPSAWIFVK